LVTLNVRHLRVRHAPHHIRRPDVYGVVLAANDLALNDRAVLESDNVKRKDLRGQQGGKQDGHLGANAPQ
jgi:hypothetical protein